MQNTEQPSYRSAKKGYYKNTPAAAVLVAIAHAVMAEHPTETDHAELAEWVKRTAARARIQYDSAAVTTALQIAGAQRASRARRALQAGDA